MYTNVDGIGNKLTEFNTFVRASKPSVICLTENKMNSDVLAGEYIDLETYQVFRKDRKNQNAPGGGVLIMVRRTLLSFDDKVNFLNNHQYKESMWCEIRLGGGVFISWCDLSPSELQ